MVVGVETLFDTATDSPRVTAAKGRVVFGAADGVGEAVVEGTRGAVAPTVLVKTRVGTRAVVSLPLLVVPDTATELLVVRFDAPAVEGGITVIRLVPGYSLRLIRAKRLWCMNPGARRPEKC